MLGARSIAMIVAVLVVQPHAITVDVVSNNGWQGFVANKLNTVQGQPVYAYAYASTDRDDSTKELREGRRQAVYLFHPNGKQDTLLINSAEESSITAAVQVIFSQSPQARSERSHRRTWCRPERRQPRLDQLLSGRRRLVGGYLLAAFLGVRGGPWARNFRRMLWRLGGCAAYAVVSGIGGALVVEPLLGARNGHFWAVPGIGMLASLTASVFTMGMEAHFAIIGIGIAVLLFVVLGNPSAGGAYGYQLLPTLGARSAHGCRTARASIRSAASSISAATPWACTRSALLVVGAGTVVVLPGQQQHPLGIPQRRFTRRRHCRHWRCRC